MSILIAPGDYVAVSDIKCEAIHAAVVKCFEAAGYKLYEGHKIGTLRGIGLGISEYLNTIESLGASVVKRQLTLQQLFTATNSIRWPDWANSVSVCGNCVAFVGCSQRATIVGYLSEFKCRAPWEQRIIATRNTVSDAELRPAPELHWYDWSADKPRELPPVGTECLVVFDQPLKKWFKAKILSHEGGQTVGRWLEGSKTGALFDYCSDMHKFRPANYEQRKADLALDQLVELICQSGYLTKHGTEATAIAERIIAAGYSKCTQ